MNKLEELFAVMTGDRRSAELAAELICSTPRFPTEDELAKLMNRQKARKVIAALELCKCDFVCEKTSVSCPEDIVRELYALKFAEQEHFVVLSFNSTNQLINKTVITKGTVNLSLVHPREVFRQALLDNAVAIAVAHNHPSGSTEPSVQDISITRVICAAGRIMQIPVIDHIIVGRGGFTSLCRQMPECFEKTYETVDHKTT